jgi:hypothetical protein
MKKAIELWHTSGSIDRSKARYALGTHDWVLFDFVAGTVKQIKNGQVTELEVKEVGWNQEQQQSDSGNWRYTWLLLSNGPSSLVYKGVDAKNDMEREWATHRNSPRWHLGQILNGFVKTGAKVLV